MALSESMMASFTDAYMHHSAPWMKHQTLVPVLYEIISNVSMF